MVDVDEVEPEDGALAVGVAAVRDADVDREGLAREGRRAGEPHLRDAVVGVRDVGGGSSGRFARNGAVDDGSGAGALDELDDGDVRRRDERALRNGDARGAVGRGRDGCGVGDAAGGGAREGRRRDGGGAGGEVAQGDRLAVRADEGDAAQPVFAGVGDVVGDDDDRARRGAEDCAVGGEAGRRGQGYLRQGRAEEDVEAEVVELEAALGHDIAAEDGDALDCAAGEGAGGVGREDRAAVGKADK